MLKSNIISKILIFIILSLLLKPNLNGQDINFSQIYSVKDYFNPGFIATNSCSEVYIHSKYQTPNIDGGYKTVTLSYSNFFPNYNSGVNIFIQNDYQPSNIINIYRIAGSYVYRIKTKKIKIALWLQTESNWLKLNTNNIVTSSMLNPYIGTTIQQSYNNLNENQTWFNLNFGYLFSMKNFFFGTSVINYAATKKINTFQKLITNIFGITKKYRLFDINAIIINRNLYQNTAAFYLITDNYWVGAGSQFYFFKPNNIYFDFGVRIQKIDFSFAYTVSVNKNLFSTYELNIKFRLKCKKEHRRAIFCPAYEL